MSNVISIDRAKRLLQKAANNEDFALSPPWGANDNNWAKQIAVVLDRHYPRWNWAVGVWSDQKAVIIRNMDLQTDWEILIRMADIDYPEFKIVMRLAGELLERAGISTQPLANFEHAEDAPQNHIGDLRLDTTAIPKSNL